MKGKLLSLLSVFTALTLASCGGVSENPSSEPSSTPSVPSTESSTPVETPSSEESSVPSETPSEESSSPEAQYQLITIAEAIQIAQQAGETVTADRYYVKGTIVNVSNSMYGEMTIKDETGELYVYGVYDKDEKTRYDAMEEKPVAGDEVILWGALKTYKGKPEMDRGYLQEFKHIDQSENIDMSQYTEKTILDARDDEENSKVKLTGVVARITYALGMKPNGFYLVDETGSIYVYDADAAQQVKIGNQITIVGEKDYFVLSTEQQYADKFGYTGSCQIANAVLISNDKLNHEIDLSFAKETTVKQIIDTPYDENITTDIFKVNALINRVEGKDFVNYYFNDIDGFTGSYAYSQASGSDYAWLDEFDGKICTVYLSPINCKSTVSGCIYRFVPIVVEDEGYTFNEENAPDFGLTYYACEQFINGYNADPNLELLSSINSELLGLGDISFTYTSDNTSSLYFETIEDKTYLHTVHSENDVKVNVTITASYKEYTARETVTITVGKEINVDSVSVIEAINSDEGAKVCVRGTVASSGVNKPVFYIADETGIVAVFLSNSSQFGEFELGDEVVIEGIKTTYIADGKDVVGQICINDAELVVNFQGDHEYSTTTFKTIDFADLTDLLNTDNAIEATAQGYVLEAEIVYVETNYYTNMKLGDPNGKLNDITIYCDNASQYSFLIPFAGQTVTIEVVLVDWNSKGYKACVLAVVTEDGKVLNNYNFK